MGLFMEKTAHYFVGVLAVALAFFLQISASDFENFKDILASAINISAITAGFLATAMSLLITLTNDSVIQRIKSFKLYNGLVQYLKSAIAWTFMVALISAAGLFLNKEHSYTEGFFYLWIFFCVVGFVSVYRIIRLLSKILDKMSN
ncbi:hypothetical protein IJ21_18110 [Paenibacillus sp. 32O-W]|uniref:hypothetical protein n=1 Tax=Paenibacillus sp. 32O-W TaxID=1695218 RepID=UPI00071F57A2|nr:hypothetical protein [Paenibacillus sp. 32O-W]ALS27212.1 hypothetical protein IJ21_18110 [Paenibacillus sp. 32O-W]